METSTEEVAWGPWEFETVHCARTSWLSTTLNCTSDNSGLSRTLLALKGQSAVSALRMIDFLVEVETSRSLSLDEIGRHLPGMNVAQVRRMKGI